MYCIAEEMILSNADSAFMGTDRLALRCKVEALSKNDVLFTPENLQTYFSGSNIRELLSSGKKLKSIAETLSTGNYADAFFASLEILESGLSEETRLICASNICEKLCPKESPKISKTVLKSLYLNFTTRDFFFYRALCKNVQEKLNSADKLTPNSKPWDIGYIDIVMSAIYQ